MDTGVESAGLANAFVFANSNGGGQVRKTRQNGRYARFYEVEECNARSADDVG